MHLCYRLRGLGIYAKFTLTSVGVFLIRRVQLVKTDDFILMSWK